MPEAVKNLLDAVTAAVDGDETPTTPDPKEPEDGAAEGSDSDESGGGESDAGEGDDSGAADAGEADDAGSTDEVADGKGAKSAGTKGEDEAAAQAGKEGKDAKVELGADGKPKPPEYKGDPLNDPPDKRWKDQTTARFHQLSTMVRERDAQITQANTLFDAIDSTGMAPEELAQMLGYARARHHGSAADKQNAYKFLQEELRALATEIGATDTVDFLTDHPDLQDAVNNNTISKEHAQEIAVSRAQKARSTAASEATAATTTAQREHAAGVNALGGVADKLQKRDGAETFQAKQAILVATLKPVLAQLKPSAWAKAYHDAYEALPKPAAPVAPAPAIVPKQQPLRPGTPAGGGAKKAPRSLKEAVFSAVEPQDD